MSNKEKTIEAIEELIHNYTNDDNETPCPLCGIHKDFKTAIWVLPDCTGCPNAVLDTYMGCCNFKTFDSLNAFKLGVPNNGPRLLFWKKALPTLEKLPPKVFTRSGFTKKAFKFLIDIDNEISDKWND